MSELAMRALEMARTQVGREEKPRGSNWGETVQMYLNSVGINFPAAWCMAFIYWCYKQAGMTKEIPKTGGCLGMWYTIADKYRSAKPAVGAIVVFDHGKGLGHVGIIESINGKELHTIEGNSNEDGVRDGYKVVRKLRYVDNPKILGYVIV